MLDASKGTLLEREPSKNVACVESSLENLDGDATRRWRILHRDVHFAVPAFTKFFEQRVLAASTNPSGECVLKFAAEVSQALVDLRERVLVRIGWRSF
jgi:hypothetical protein